MISIVITAAISAIILVSLILAHGDDE